jgi:hypothetical protein
MRRAWRHKDFACEKQKKGEAGYGFGEGKAFYNQMGCWLALEIAIYND